MSRENNYTLNQICQLAWGYTLAQTIKANDVVFGTTISYRPPSISSVTELVGLFVATPPLRIKFDKQIPQLLNSINETQQDRYENGLFDLNKYDEKWRPTAPHSTLYVFQNFPKKINKLQPNLRYDFIKTTSGSNQQIVAHCIPGYKLEIKLYFDNHKISLNYAQLIMDAFKQNITDIIKSLQHPTSMVSNGYNLKECEPIIAL